MIAAAALTLAFALNLAQVPLSMPASGRDAAELAAAQKLYAAAAYEEALDRLGRIGLSDTLADQADMYRALCLLALGRTTESEQVIERTLRRNPRFEVDDREVSPRLVTLYEAVRARLLPTTARDLYAAARVSFDDRQYGTAARQLRDVLNLVAAAPSESSLGDLKLLAEEFLRLAESMSAAAGSDAATTSSSVVGTGPIFSVLDREVVAPVEIARPLPVMFAPRGSQPGLYQGLVEIVVSVTGRVESAMTRKSITPAFDAEIRAAALLWRFQPASRNGIPVRYRRSYEIIGHSR